MNYREIYEDKLIRISFTNSEGYPKVATGHIIEDDETHILVHTVKGETPLIKKENISNIFDLVNDGNK